MQDITEEQGKTLIKERAMLTKRRMVTSVWKSRRTNCGGGSNQILQIATIRLQRPVVNNGVSVS